MIRGARPALPAIVFACAMLAFAGCASTSKPKPAPSNQQEAKRAAVAATIDPMKLQSGLLALADTGVQRVAAATQVEGRKFDPLTRQRLLGTRLALSSAEFGIVTGPDQIDALLDILTHTALVAEAQRNLAKGAAPGSPDDALRIALDRNEADAWKLAEQWLDPQVREALRARIAALPLQRDDPRQVAYVRLADLPRAGNASVEAGDGLTDSLRAATEQADQVRLLAERSLFLMQRMPFLMRWQAQAYSYDTLGLDETQKLLKELGDLSVSTAEAAKMVATMPASISKERVAALEDLFTKIRIERQQALEQLAVMIRDERKAALDQVSADVTMQREAAFADLLKVAGDAENRGSNLLWVLVQAGAILIFVFLASLLGMMLVYRRFVPRETRRLPD